jgi:peptidyl-prolyl cis-trans isomerase A (cyclophilin A)
MSHRFALIAILAAGLFSIALAPASAQERGKEALMNPAEANETAPDTFQVLFDTTKGEFTIEVTRAWAPNGADRFYNLVRRGYYDDVRFFRVLSGFMAQFGISGDPQLNTIWREARIPDDTVAESNRRGYVSFATSGANTRTTQMFINYGNNSGLDSQGFSPFGRVTDGMDVVDDLYSGYGEGAPSGRGPSQQLLQTQGNPYLIENFPDLDYINQATIVE